MLAKLHRQKKNIFFKKGCGTPSGFNVIWKKEKKINLYLYFSNVIKRTRVVTRLSPSRVEYLGLCSPPWAPGCPRGVTQMSLCVCTPLSRARVQRLPHFLAFCLQIDASLLLLPFKGHHLSALNQFQPVNCIMCLGPATLRFCFLHSFKSIHCM